jgi:hypothetical protein
VRRQAGEPRGALGAGRGRGEAQPAGDGGEDDRGDGGEENDVDGARPGERLGSERSHGKRRRGGEHRRQGGRGPRRPAELIGGAPPE